MHIHNYRASGNREATLKQKTNRRDSISQEPQKRQPQILQICAIFVQEECIKKCEELKNYSG